MGGIDRDGSIHRRAAQIEGCQPRRHAKPGHAAIKRDEAQLRVGGQAHEVAAADLDLGRAVGAGMNCVAAYKEKLAARDPDYERDRNFDSLIAYLFPETWSILSREEEV